MQSIDLWIVDDCRLEHFRAILHFRSNFHSQCYRETVSTGIWIRSSVIETLIVLTKFVYIALYSWYHRDIYFILMSFSRQQSIWWNDKTKLNFRFWSCLWNKRLKIKGKPKISTNPNHSKSIRVSKTAKRKRARRDKIAHTHTHSIHQNTIESVNSIFPVLF